MTRAYLLLDRYHHAFWAAAASQGLRDCPEAEAVFAHYSPLNIQFYLRVEPLVAYERIVAREGGPMRARTRSVSSGLRREYDRMMAADKSTIVLDGAETPIVLHRRIVAEIERRALIGESAL